MATEHRIAGAFGFTHGLDAAGDPCEHDDADLLFCEQYIGVETRRINGMTTGGGKVGLTLSPDALSDETRSVIKTEVECRYCDGAAVTINTDAITIEYDYA